jgi:hypothetical protein
MRATSGNNGNGNTGNNGVSEGVDGQGRTAKPSATDKRQGDSERGSHKLHARTCSICGHARREDIEKDFLAWGSPKQIVKEYKLGNRAAVYRHAHAFGLMERRYVDLRAALGRIIEKAGEVPVTAWAVVAAVRACAKINARGQWMERDESNGMRELLDGMNREELLAYAEHGTLPGWFHGTRVAAVDELETEADEPEKPGE